MTFQRGLTIIELLVSLAVGGLLLAFALPQFIKARDAALDAQTKSNLLTIQVALQRYSTDNGGYAPVYLYGGSLKALYPQGLGINYRGANDSLITFGYIQSYPTNPFNLDFQLLCKLTNVDPRFGCIRSSFGEVRGGYFMGNILSDPNFPGVGSANCRDVQRDCGTRSPAGDRALIAYYFIGDDDSGTVDWIPGEFAYRSLLLHRWMYGMFEVRPSMYVGYVLAAYGNPGTRGMDYFHCTGKASRVSYGDKYWGTFEGSTEFAGSMDSCKSRGRGAFDPVELSVYEPAYWDAIEGKSIAPYPNVAFHVEGDNVDTFRFRYGNPDGYPDGIIAVFTSEDKLENK